MNKDCTINFKFGDLPYKGISEFDRIVGDMEVLLDGVRLKDRRIGRKWKNQDISFLGGELSEYPRKYLLLIRHFVSPKKQKLLQIKSMLAKHWNYIGDGWIGFDKKG